VLEQNFAVPGDEHGASELVGARSLLGMLGERCQGVRFGHPVQDEIHRARRLRGDQKLDPLVGVPADGLETNVVHRSAQRSSIIRLGEAQANRLALPSR
jgi:hypothetical protein